MAKGRKTGGRQKGTPNKATAEAKAAALKILADPLYWAKLLERAQEGKLHPGVEVMLWHYAHGKPTEHIEHDHQGGLLITWQTE
jgi:hypothetical protein